MHIDDYLTLISGSNYTKRNNSSALLVGEDGESPVAVPPRKHKSYYEVLFDII